MRYNENEDHDEDEPDYEDDDDDVMLEVIAQPPYAPTKLYF